MTGKERWLAALNMQPFDRFLFYPKYSVTFQNYLTGPMKSKTRDDIIDWIGADDCGDVTQVGMEVRTHSSFDADITSHKKVFTYMTKYGTCRAVHSLDPNTNSFHPTEFPIKTVEDIKIMTAWYRDITNKLNEDSLKRANEQAAALGDTTVLSSTVAPQNRSETSIMHFMEWLAGIVEGQFMLADYPDEVHELFDAINDDMKSKVKLHAEYSPAEVLMIYENTSTTIISPSQYAEYCAGTMDELAQILHDHGKHFMIHMCGHLKNILPHINNLKADSIEALTPPTVGDTDFVMARKACPNKAFIGGTHATMWTSTPEKVIEYLDNQFQQLPHHRGIIPSSGGEMPPICPPEFIKKVTDFIKTYKVRC